jgi:hypothetical protein
MTYKNITYDIIINTTKQVIKGWRFGAEEGYYGEKDFECMEDQLLAKYLGYEVF